MKLFANGSNIYKQFNRDEDIIENFTLVHESEVIKSCFVNHSYSVFQTETGLLIFFPVGVKHVFCENKIVDIASNDDRIIALEETGQLLKFELCHFDRPINVPNFLHSEDPQERIIGISCGAKITVAHSSKGKLFNGTQNLVFEKSDIISIECGREHCLILDKSGNVYSFGIGSRGQLGHGELDDEPEPVLIEALAGIKIIQISTGGWHSCALSEDEDLYTWGWNVNGQLGLTRIEEEHVPVMAAPQLVDIGDENMNISRVAAGSRHTILSAGNSLYGCGWNKYKQLKNDAKENFYAFTHLHNFSNSEVLDVKCGSWNSMVLCK